MQAATELQLRVYEAGRRSSSIIEWAADTIAAPGLDPTVRRTISSSRFGTRYRYGPVSPRYALDRPQDVALQNSRSNVNLRNHMRLWRAPVNVDGTGFWAGQISRDIGVRPTTKTITTHKIDPEVDGARWYLMQDMFYSQSLLRYAFAKGVGEATPESPRVNYTGDSYWTDGLRLVMWLSGAR